jgi:hypothetical protein
MFGTMRCSGKVNLAEPIMYYHFHNSQEVVRMNST